MFTFFAFLFSLKLWRRGKHKRDVLIATLYSVQNKPSLVSIAQIVKTVCKLDKTQTCWEPICR